MIKTLSLFAGYGEKTVLHGINLELESGKVHLIVGPNGCGKSTLLKAIAGILPVTSGTVLLDDCDASKLSDRQRAQKVAYLAQERQIPDITVARMVLHGRFPYLSYPRRYRKEDLRIADAAMEQMEILQWRDEPVATLSGGMRQKVYIAMALAQDTPAILMDEPTTFLDVAHQLQMAEQARMLADAGKAVVVVLHDLPLAMQLADRLTVLDAGSVVAAGTPEEVFTSGCLDRVFGVQVRRFRTETGWQYYYETAR